MSCNGAQLSYLFRGQIRQFNLTAEDLSDKSDWKTDLWGRSG
jgi:hypothetical protein